MITDAMLKEATEEAERYLVTTLSNGDVQKHQFSSRFERKMERLIRRANHPVRYQVMRSAAAVILVLLTLFGAVRTVSPEVGISSSSVGWFRRALSSLFQYINHTPDDPNARYVYYLPGVPEGYDLQNIIEKEDGKTYIYANDSNMIRFSYTYGGDGSLSAASENYHISDAAVGQCAAKVYIAKNSDETNMIVWQDSSGSVRFSISAMLDEQALIELAESVEKN